MQHHVHGRAENNDVADGAQSGTLAQRYPGQQDDDPDRDRQGPDLMSGDFGQALMQDVPRIQSETSADLHCRRASVQDQTEVQLDQPTCPSAAAASHFISMPVHLARRIGPILN